MNFEAARVEAQGKPFRGTAAGADRTLSPEHVARTQAGRRLAKTARNEVISEQERELNIHLRLLREESSGILNWALQGLREQQIRGLDPPAAVRAATQAYKEEQDTIGTFLRECCEIDQQQVLLGKNSEHQEGAGTLYKTYNDWAKEMGYRPQSQKRLAQNLIRHGLRSGRDVPGRVVWFGIKVRSECKNRFGIAAR